MQTLKSIGLDFKRIPLPESVLINPNNQYTPHLEAGTKKSYIHPVEPSPLNSDFERSLGPNFEAYVQTHANTGLDIHFKDNTDEMLWLNFKDEDIIENNSIVIEPYKKATVVLSYEGEMVHHGSTKVLVKEGAELTLIKFQSNSLESQYVDQTLIEVEDRGLIKVIDIQIGSKNMIVNYDTNLKGYQSKCDYKSIYMAADERGLDLSFTANHMGKKSESDILGKGVLSGQARKVFRGTLNFVDGSAQSVGKEEEIVLLLSEKVKADSIPALMCQEDDVIGEHGASIGQLDEEQLFYLMSRGLPESEAKLLVIASGFREILEGITDEKLRLKSLDAIDRRIQDVI
jgi:Fe-S cluster assembly scaffold protein SufB